MTTVKTGNAYLDSLKVKKEPYKVDDGKNKSLSQEDFFKLLTQQLSQQDPSKPVDNDKMLSQMASISTVEGINNMTKKFESLNTVMTSSQALQASTLVGQKVLIPTNVANKPANGGIDAVISMPTSSSGDVIVNIENAAGELVRTMNIGKQAPGNNEFTWDGKDKDGNMLKEGKYTIKATGTVGDKKQDLAVSSYNHVSSVNLGNGKNGVILNLRGLGNIALSEVLAVAES